MNIYIYIYHDEGLHPYVNAKDGKSRWARVQWPCQDDGPTSIGLGR